MSDTVRHLCVARFGGTDLFFLWDSGGASDQIVVDDAGVVLTFQSEDGAREAARSEARVVSSERPTRYDFDALQDWCQSSADVHDCSTLLDGWNMLGDLPHSENLFAGADVRSNHVFEKL